MTSRVGFMSAFRLLVVTTLMECNSHRREFPALVTSAKEVRLQDIWTQLQTEMNLDPSRSSWVEKMNWELWPDETVRRFFMQVRATGVGEDSPSLYQVEGETEKAWFWLRAFENPSGHSLNQRAVRFGIDPKVVIP